MCEATFWRECNCCCLFSFSTIMMLLMVTLLLNDLSQISKQQTMLEHIVNTAAQQLNCLDICEPWYTEERGIRCCDRNNIYLCMQKYRCRIDYDKRSRRQMGLLLDHCLNQIIVAVVCLLIIIMVVLGKIKQYDRKKMLMISYAFLKILIKSLDEKWAKRKVEETQPHYKTISVFNTSQFETCEGSLFTPNIISFQANQKSCSIHAQNQIMAHSSKDQYL